MDRRHFMNSAAVVTALGIGSSALSGLTSRVQAGAAQKGSAAEKLNTVFDTIYNQYIDNSPTLATSLGLDKGPRAHLKSKLGSANITEDKADHARLKANIKAIKSVPRQNLSGMDRINYDTVLWSLENALTGYDQFQFGNWGSAQPYVLSQLTGAYRSTPDFLANQHTIETKQDAEDFLARMEDFGRVVNEETTRHKEDVAKGIIPPDFAMQKALTQIEAIMAIKASENSMTKALVTKTRAKSIDGDWGERAKALLDGPILSAMQAQKEALESSLTKAKHTAGVWGLKQGEAYYAWAAKTGTTTSMSPDEIHKVGLEMVAQLTAEADTAFKAMGMTKGSVGERMKALGEDPQYIYENTDEAKEKLLEDLNVQIRAIEAKLPEWFGVLPKTAVTVRRVPKEIEAGAPGGYYQRPTLDGSRPGAYYINLRDTKEWPTWSLPTLTYHEAIPGHHMQISIQMEAQGLPSLRKIGGFSAYSEGWALYSELVAAEMGMYANDKPGYIGYLQSALFRAIRLVVDTGMHSKRWTREEAVAYFVATNGDAESSSITEVERYCVWPGQALSYMMGKIQFMKIRDMAKAELKDRFDIKSFHDRGLTCGPVPLAVLETVYKEWLAGA
jgi:uncharacterized protein (DUF885 family)